MFGGFLFGLFLLLPEPVRRTPGGRVRKSGGLSRGGREEAQSLAGGRLKKRETLGVVAVSPSPVFSASFPLSSLFSSPTSRGGDEEGHPPSSSRLKKRQQQKVKDTSPIPKEERQRELYRLEVPIERRPRQISFSSRIVLLGSCFSENVGRRLKEELHFPNVSMNAAGTLYHPLNICAVLDEAMRRKETESADAEDRQETETAYNPSTGLWSSWDFHSRFSSPSKPSLLSSIHRSLNALGELMFPSPPSTEEAQTEERDSPRDTGEGHKDTLHLFLTFGSAFGYWLTSPPDPPPPSLEEKKDEISSGNAEKKNEKPEILSEDSFTEVSEKRLSFPVANCHKFPQRLFEKRLSDPDELAGRLLETLLRLSERCRKEKQFLRVYLTVSPVRHWKDGPVENNRSKATLLLLCGKVIEMLQGKRQKGAQKPNEAFSSASDGLKGPEQNLEVVYFPSYELVMDELRDYRFFEEDMLHPNKVAIDFVWRRLAGALLTAECEAGTREVEGLNRAAMHRPFWPGSEKHKEFLHKQMKRAEALEREHENLDLFRLKNAFQKELNSCGDDPTEGT
uniref:GSCFA domain-containing protein n=1 Tax=Chromera velia CCMP2878 TaxID=1169474 RepID=A0A0G4H3N2_9ALVE|eukprot:Cvel_24579.t1-p1 / transcript=Cvel_24579.t1 / gene=Cvel_24579 / organism=Chromera_velia_CCMP2878 / gene_product=hypothetical protein / transcript_product=hypothetical protein / location=Cvel_scaffold2675:7966-11917(+) / protein_length=564 / sequence_SO=supercontig / SO=protein_coding / is_pseudo=false